MEEYIEYDCCTICPRMCRINRNNNEKGYCGETAFPRVGKAYLHMWEEPCISGDKGSGTVFFSGCNLKCTFCQNHELSENKAGVFVTTKNLVQTYIGLQNKGALNINLVTAEHFIPHIVQSVKIAKDNGLTIPIVFNCGSYITKESLQKLKDVVDIYLPDFKYYDNEIAKRYSSARDYRQTAQRAIEQMYRMQPDLVYDENGILKKGVIVRHLCMPGNVRDSKNVLKYLYEKYGDKICYSIMNQYTPMKKSHEFAELNRKLTKKEYDSVIDYCIELGMENAYIQEEGTAAESFVPIFDGEGIIK